MRVWCTLCWVGGGGGRGYLVMTGSSGPVIGLCDMTIAIMLVGSTILCSQIYTGYII